MALLHEELTAKIIGVAMEVHRTLGHGFAESVYQEALELESKWQGLRFEPQQMLTIKYKERSLKEKYKPDFIFDGKVIVEIKALQKLTSNEEAQLINYLKATGCEVGLLINFGAKSLEWKRLVLTQR